MVTNVVVCVRAHAGVRGAGRRDDRLRDGKHHILLPRLLQLNHGANLFANCLDERLRDVASGPHDRLNERRCARSQLRNRVAHSRNSEGKRIGGRLQQRLKAVHCRIGQVGYEVLELGVGLYATQSGVA